MATRHRIPTIFNLSMVDVLCCALGCVILLWLINLREAKQRTESAGQTTALLAQTQSRLEDTDQRLEAITTRLRQTTAERDGLAARAETAETERAALQSKRTDLEKAVAALREQYADAQDRLAKKLKEQRALAKDLAAARQRVEDLDILVREKETLAKASARGADELAEKLRDADARLKQARSVAESVPDLRAKLAVAETARAALQKEAEDRTRALDGLETAKRRLEREATSLTRQLADAERGLTALRDEKKTLADQMNRARVAAENRFAGIALTGKRVVFLVDMSGSMELVDENTTAPEKWIGVRQTLAKVMKSIPELEKFQVILFSSKASYLLGKEGQWLDFDPVTSSGRVAEALAAVKPKGNTDMYAAFEAAFAFRSQGLDTVYVLSDGLPNIGAGLSAEQARTLKETERAEILSRHVRRTLLNGWNRPQSGRPRVRINTIGFFYESPDVGAFLWALAREHDGGFVGMSRP